MKFVLLITLALTITSCGDYGTSLPASDTGNAIAYTGTDPFTSEELASINSGSFSKEKLIMNIGINVINPAATRFYNDALNLHTQTRNLCSQYRVNNSDTALEEDLKGLWKKTMESYHFLEAMMIGPMANDDYDLRYKLYSFALTKTNTCSIDREIVKIYDNPDSRFRTTFNKTGLDALEYLYYSPAEHTCRKPRGSMNTWSELPEVERKQTKCAYIQRTTDHLLETARTLRNFWHPNFVNLTKKMITDRTFGNVDQTINAISDTLFYLDKDVKDNKLAMPLGLNEQCADDTCPDSIEHKSSKFSFSALYYNLLGFKSILNGKDYMSVRSIDGFGFDDYLDTKNAGELKNRMNLNLDRALTNLEKLKNSDFEQLISSLDKTSCENSTTENRLVEVCAIHKDVKKITDDLKNDFLVYLALKAPDQAQGDND